MTNQNQDKIPSLEKPGATGNVWRAVAIGLVSIILIICIVFALPFVNKPVEVVETYTDTEYKEEAYTESEPYTTQVTAEVTERKSQTLYKDALAEIRRILPFVWVAEFPFNLNIIGKSNPVVSGSWEVLDTYTTSYVTINDPGYSQVYKYLGVLGAAQADDFEFIPKLSGRYLMRFQTEAPRILKYAKLTMLLEWDEVSTKTTERTENRYSNKIHAKINWILQYAFQWLHECIRTWLLQEFINSRLLAYCNHSNSFFESTVKTIAANPTSDKGKKAAIEPARANPQFFLRST
jgi:hypothetical protein